MGTSMYRLKPSRSSNAKYKKCITILARYSAAHRGGSSGSRSDPKSMSTDRDVSNKAV